MIETWAGGAAQPNLGARDLGRFVIAIPPPHEQDKIACVLADIESNISTLSELIQKKRHIKLAAMQELLTGKRRLPGFEGEWEVTTLFDLANRKKEFFDDGDWIESEHIRNEGIRLIQTGNIPLCQRRCFICFVCGHPCGPS
jgi:type I restriction enzyme S subunit